MSTLKVVLPLTELVTTMYLKMSWINFPQNDLFILWHELVLRTVLGPKPYVTGISKKAFFRKPVVRISYSPNDV